MKQKSGGQNAVAVVVRCYINNFQPVQKWETERKWINLN